VRHQVLFRLAKDPLVHFLALGLGLFVLYAAFNPDSRHADDPKRIVVDYDALLTFIQYRTKTFKPELAQARLNGMSNDKLQRLIDDYVREEALHREAKALGLGSEDYIIKRRMIQKIEFITQGFAEAVVKATEKDLKAYHLANKDRYREPGNITFTHVFFDAERRTLGEAGALATAKLEELRAASAAFSDAPRHGERFPYGVNYVERTNDHVASHVGQEMTDTLFQLTPADNVWHGPYMSTYGAHLVMVIKRIDARDPPLEELRSRVEADLVRDRRKEQAEKAVQAIVDSYRVKLEVVGKDGKSLAQMDAGN
jgi:hypothetical protein